MGVTAHRCVVPVSGLVGIHQRQLDAVRGAVRLSCSEPQFPPLEVGELEPGLSKGPFHSANSGTCASLGEALKQKGFCSYSSMEVKCHGLRSQISWVPIPA